MEAILNWVVSNSLPLVGTSCTFHFISCSVNYEIFYEHAHAHKHDPSAVSACIIYLF